MKKRSGDLDRMLEKIENAAREAAATTTVIGREQLRCHFDQSNLRR